MTRPMSTQPTWLLVIKELRAPFFAAPLMPVVLGTAIAFADTGRCDWLLFGLAALGVAFINAAANVANDYFDHRSGNDELNTEFVRPFTGGSRMIQNGLLAPRDLVIISVTAACLALLVAAYLAWKVGIILLAFGVVGLASGVLYTAPVVNLAARGLGECAIGINVGVLPVVGAYYVQTRSWSWTALLLSLPFAILIAAILFINQFQDYDADKAVGKRNWVVRLGRRTSSFIHIGLVTLWSVPIIVALLIKACPPLCAIALLALIPAALAIRTVRHHYDHPAALVPANIMTIVTGLAAGALLSASLVASRLIP